MDREAHTVAVAVLRRELGEAFATAPKCLNLRILAYMVRYDAGNVALEHLLISCTFPRMKPEALKNTGRRTRWPWPCFAASSGRHSSLFLHSASAAL